MSMSTPIVPLLIKGATWIGCSYLCYELYKIQKYENKVKKVEAQREHRKRLGQSTEDIETPPEVKQYLDEHYGRKLQERMQTQYLIEDNLKHQIEQKKLLRDKIKEDVGAEELQQIDDDIERLNNLFRQVSPNKKIAHPAQEFLNKKDRM